MFIKIYVEQCSLCYSVVHMIRLELCSLFY